MSVLRQFSLDRKVVVLTGARGLYGRPFARALAQAGATLIITSRGIEHANALAQELRSDGLSCAAMQLDLSDPNDIERFSADLHSQVDHVDVLVNNAVHREGGGLFDTTAENWDTTSAVNSRGTFLLTQAIAHHMVKAESGCIINIGSIYGLVGPDFSLYTGTTMTSPLFYAYDKAGLVGLTRYLATALGPKGVRVNCLCPGGLLGDQDARFVDAYNATTPLRRMAQAEDVTGALIFLASDAARYVTGVALPVDGGRTAQ